jgi:hypothetical protein
MMPKSEESTHVCACGGNCGCHDDIADTQQVVLTREDYIVRLEDYLSRLKEEIQLVEAELADLRVVA